jgi:hypothetical protein
MISKRIGLDTHGGLVLQIIVSLIISIETGLSLETHPRRKGRVCLMLKINLNLRRKIRVNGVVINSDLAINSSC